MIDLYNGDCLESLVKNLTVTLSVLKKDDNYFDIAKKRIEEVCKDF